MNFIEAVEAMKEGKQVRRCSSKHLVLYIPEGETIFAYVHTGHPMLIGTNNFEATDWEIVEERNPAHFCNGIECDKYLGFRGFCSEECHNGFHDKFYDNSIEDNDWNLAINEGYETLMVGDTITDLFWKKDVKKCRDLITNDLKATNSFAEVVKILAKRFGDLK